MLTLALIGLVGGLITGVSPCVLPMLPIVFFAAGTDDAKAPGRRRAVVITAGLVTGFSVFTLAGAALLSLVGLPDDFLRWTGVVLLVAVGLGMLIPSLGHLLERPFYRLPKVAGRNSGPFVLGLGLGTLYVPCAGPVLAAITVAGASGQIGVGTVVLTLSFAIGAALPLLFFAAAGANIRARITRYQSRMQLFRILGGVVLIGLAIGLAFNATALIQRTVPNYTKGLEDRLNSSETVRGALTPFATSENRLLSRCEPGADDLADCGPAPQLRGTGRWFNTAGGKPLTLAGLRGKVVLLDFFAYSCINCQRDQPYVEKWAHTYAGNGLEVIGVHSPEFAFERDAGNLATSLKREGTTYPVVQDNMLKTWTAYRNRYWPAKYLIDREGRVRAIKFGEGDYAQTESLIRRLLAEGGSTRVLPRPVTTADTGNQTEGQTPELYVADHKPGYVGVPTYIRSGLGDYSFAPGAQPRDTYGFAGTWSTGDDGMDAGANARIRLHFRAKDVFHVLGGRGTVTVKRPGHDDRVIRVSGPPNLHALVTGKRVVDETIIVTYSAGVEVYTFTFG
jgi:cytochrome c biogenesis protein CcdA/thiol-disulfide isomerase/thioredoxin